MRKWASKLNERIVFLEVVRNRTDRKKPRLRKGTKRESESEKASKQGHPLQKAIASAFMFFSTLYVL